MFETENALGSRTSGRLVWWNYVYLSRTDLLMSLNVKDPEAYRLAQLIARATGESMTHVVREALRARYAQIEQRNGRASVDELLAIADRAAAHVKPPYADHADLLYDADGLPQ